MRPLLRPTPLILLAALLGGCADEADLGQLGTAAAASSPPAAARATPAATVATVEPRQEAPEAAPRAEARKERVELNAAILEVIQDYATGGQHPYVWSRGVNTDGVTQPLSWRGTLLAAPEAGGGIHCSGITYEVYLRALAKVVGEEQGPDAETLLAMKETWYVRDGGDLGPVGALVEAGLGDRVDGLAELKPGDLVQFWRNSGKGHSVVFINHTRNSDGSPRGMIYWSAQGTSGGIGMRRVSPGTDINQIAPGRLYGVRARWPARG